MTDSQLLKAREAAKDAGDRATYQTLTEEAIRRGLIRAPWALR